MIRFLARRIVYYVVLVFLATSLTYFLASATFSPRSVYAQRNPAPPVAVIDAKLDHIGVNDKTPIIVRYGHWLGDAVHGDLGQTIQDRSVDDAFWPRLGVSLRLLLVGSVIGIVIGVLVGVWNAIRQYRISDRVSAIISIFLISTPVFLTAVFLKIGATKLNQDTGQQLINFTGEATPGLTGTWWDLFVDRGVHLLLPTISIALGLIAIYSRYQRATMLDVLGSDFLRTARAKGLTRRQATFKHGLRTALIPMTTLFAYGFLGILTGATFTEKIFGWNGLGAWFIDSVQGNDVNAVTAYTLFASVVVLIAGFLADVMTAALDPRVRRS
ncbi:ABC transporter permease [Curtobacterium sp. RRHDQ66]|uniref:ABC transporter permease n=1 Tax=Curtobacterium TaxID=2034 RepID=UPI0007D72119|nr:ABC transporter permease [Curtobacterium sp. 9128]SBN62606.1 peptide/nickel transport system permease protein [Curtobacterium sp. 9128]